MYNIGFNWWIHNLCWLSNQWVFIKQIKNVLHIINTSYKKLQPMFKPDGWTPNAEDYKGYDKFIKILTGAAAEEEEEEDIFDFFVAPVEEQQPITPVKEQQPIPIDNKNNSTNVINGGVGSQKVISIDETPSPPPPPQTHTMEESENSDVSLDKNTFPKTLLNSNLLYQSSAEIPTQFRQWRRQQESKKEESEIKSEDGLNEWELNEGEENLSFLKTDPAFKIEKIQPHMFFGCKKEILEQINELAAQIKTDKILTTEEYNNWIQPVIVFLT